MQKMAYSRFGLRIVHAKRNATCASQHRNRRLPHAQEAEAFSRPSHRKQERYLRLPTSPSSSTAHAQATGAAARHSVRQERYLRLPTSPSSSTRLARASRGGHRSSLAQVGGVARSTRPSTTMRRQARTEGIASDSIWPLMAGQHASARDIGLLQFVLKGLGSCAGADDVSRLRRFHVPPAQCTACGGRRMHADLSLSSTSFHMECLLKANSSARCFAMFGSSRPSLAMCALM